MFRKTSEGIGTVTDTEGRPRRPQDPTQASRLPGDASPSGQEDRAKPLTDRPEGMPQPR